MSVMEQVCSSSYSLGKSVNTDDDLKCIPQIYIVHSNSNVLFLTGLYAQSTMEISLKTCILFCCV